jgi:hypothetical protein
MEYSPFAILYRDNRGKIGFWEGDKGYIKK